MKLSQKLDWVLACVLSVGVIVGAVVMVLQEVLK